MREHGTTFRRASPGHPTERADDIGSAVIDAIASFAGFLPLDER